MTYHMFALAAGFLLDLCFGDPRWMYHPVCLIGNLISLLERGIRRFFPKTEQVCWKSSWSALSAEEFPYLF